MSLGNYVTTQSILILFKLTSISWKTRILVALIHFAGNMIRWWLKDILTKRKQRVSSDTQINS